MAVTLMLSACQTVQPTRPAQATVTSSAIPSVIAPLGASSALILDTPDLPIATPPATSTPWTVLVTAFKGNLFIRRGPDLAFNSIAVLMDGESAKALGRDVLGKWLQIPLPGHPHQMGWVSIQSHYSVVSGDIWSLPEVEPRQWPALAFLRNCTGHQMEADPGGWVIPSADNFPANEVQINPGVYTIHDVELDGRPEVMQVEIREGSDIEIRDDGTGRHKKCAVP